MNCLGKIKFKASKNNETDNHIAYITSDGILFNKKVYDTIITRKFFVMLQEDGYIETELISEKIIK